MTMITATELKNHLGHYLHQAYREPVIISKTGRPSVVMLAYTDYDRLFLGMQQDAEKAANQRAMQALTKTQKEFRRLNKNKISLVDELIAERRVEAKQEK